MSKTLSAIVLKKEKCIPVLIRAMAGEEKGDSKVCNGGFSLVINTRQEMLLHF